MSLFRLRHAALLGVALLLAAAGPYAHAETTVLKVIAHPSVRAERLELSELRDLFLGRIRTIGGKEVIPLNYPPRSRWRRLFDRTVLNMDPEQAGRYWVDTRIRGGGYPPRSLPTPEIMVRVVAALRGAVSYVPADTPLIGGVKSIRVEGLTP